LCVIRNWQVSICTRITIFSLQFHWNTEKVSQFYADTTPSQLTQQWRIHHCDAILPGKMGSFHCHISLPDGRLLGGQAADQSLEEELGKLKKASEEADGI